MIDALAQLSGLTTAYIWHGFLVFLRIGAIVSLAPGVGETTIPARVKLVIALAITVPLAASLPPFAGHPTAELMAWAILTETIAGVVLGLSLRLFVHGLQLAGAIAAQATSLAQVFAAAGSDPQPAMGRVLVVGALALAMILQLHVKLLGFTRLSYDLFPALVLPSPSVVGQWGLSVVSRVFTLGFMLAMPFVIVSLLYNLALGAINRAMPQLMVAFVGAPAITFGSLVLLLLLAPLMLDTWFMALENFMADPSGHSR